MQKIGAISKSPNRYQQLSIIAFAICVSIRYGIIDYRVQRYNPNPPKSKFFQYLISHLEFFAQQKTARNPFIYGHFRAFFKHEKKWNRDITFYLIPIIKTYETQTFIPQSFYSVLVKVEA